MGEPSASPAPGAARGHPELASWFLNGETHTLTVAAGNTEPVLTFPSLWHLFYCLPQAEGRAGT